MKKNGTLMWWSFGVQPLLIVGSFVISGQEWAELNGLPGILMSGSLLAGLVAIVSSIALASQSRRWRWLSLTAVSLILVAPALLFRTMCC